MKNLLDNTILTRFNTLISPSNINHYNKLHICYKESRKGGVLLEGRSALLLTRYIIKNL